MTLGQKLKDLRNRAGIGQAEVAAEMGVSTPTVSEWENGKKNPSSGKLAALAIFYSVSTDYLLGNEELPPGDKDKKLFVRRRGEVGNLGASMRESRYLVNEIETLMKELGEDNDNLKRLLELRKNMLDNAKELIDTQNKWIDQSKKRSEVLQNDATVFAKALRELLSRPEVRSQVLAGGEAEAWSDIEHRVRLFLHREAGEDDDASSVSG
ncbi:helix-turn-helix domain-containing protein [Roseomonas sp. NAR14]|uniref:Helix-turn-helix domain-containing protein n=1 Tax=Roseomonas acroporae TaxID=2937791 RepID=A0A9X1YAP8_9PROT|nr:helix-turn-helix domain-containing protein [Roseomonas acroporae]MCK8785237.1 helix-turn-helix domain-containing protein [Roseomonas acroporae]